MAIALAAGIIAGIVYGAKTGWNWVETGAVAVTWVMLFFAFCRRRS
jgi:hypothetical protein